MCMLFVSKKMKRNIFVCTKIFLHISDDVPDEIIHQISSYLDLPTLTTTISLVNKRWNYIVENNNKLWETFSFSYPINLDERALQKIYKHCNFFTTFLGGNAEITINAPLQDLYFNNIFSCAKNIVYLELDNTEVSSLFALKYLKSLEILSLNHCINIQNCDIEVLEQLQNIEQLYIMHTSISARAICDVFKEGRSKLFVLDLQGTEFIYSEILTVLRILPNLNFFGLSLFETISLANFDSTFRPK
ncbi:unnamed protein product [Owenia fusiformis]|uniref:F-box domain-containing protein n=1 Tax=Owenia fusiformis TaxID=6347 RepID=A0A8S4MY43_OWEFU|nr:unnamed protein product [Owenia fusiformis]